MKDIPSVRQKTTPLAADTYLAPYLSGLTERQKYARCVESRLTGDEMSLTDFASGHEYYGMHFKDGLCVFREWAPNAEKIFLVGDFSEWRELPEFSLRSLGKHGSWEIVLPEETMRHGMHYCLRIYWPGGEGDRLPTYARYVTQDPQTLIFSARVWRPETSFVFRYQSPPRPDALLIYEAHVGMAREHGGIGSFREFKDNILPMIVAAGYNTIQLMAVMNHPYYGSFGYHVSNYFSIASRFGTPEELKELVDEAHRLGLRVVMDLIHSHAVKNEVEGLARFDGTIYQYFHAGERGEHRMWDSLCFNYHKPEVLHFLLSNCRFWLDEYKVDGFRFDGVTSMLYLHHGLGYAFTSYDDYFNNQVDEDALAYLTLANSVIHAVRPDAVTIAEDVSGMPGLAAPVKDGGCGFDYRLAMGVTDYWFKLFDQPDENWSISGLWHELTNRRPEEKTISYVECHDQSIVGGQTAIFRMIGNAMYDAMRVDSQNSQVDRGIALHKMIRLATLATASDGYLNFMGNEFGHPEWVDFPREGNNWSYHYARRQWSLAIAEDLRYRFLAEFDRAMLNLVNQYQIINYLPRKLRIADDDKVMAFERGGLFFFFNFHPTSSLVDYPVEVLPGEYLLTLDSDAAEFGGHCRITPQQRYFTRREKREASLCDEILLYLPCRTTLVLRKL